MGGFHSGSGMGPSSISPPTCSWAALQAECTQEPWLNGTHQKMAHFLNKTVIYVYTVPQSVEVTPIGHQAKRRVPWAVPPCGNLI